MAGFFEGRSRYAGAALPVLLLALAPAFANAAKMGVQISAKASFREAGYVVISSVRARASLPEIDPAGDDSFMEHSISIKSVPGETVMVSCNVETWREAEGSEAERNCSGNKKADIQSAHSGDHVTSKIELTDDLISVNGDDPTSGVSIAISYI